MSLQLEHIFSRVDSVWSFAVQTTASAVFVSADLLNLTHHLRQPPDIPEITVQPPTPVQQFPKEVSSAIRQPKVRRRVQKTCLVPAQTSLELLEPLFQTIDVVWLLGVETAANLVVWSLCRRPHGPGLSDSLKTPRAKKRVTEPSTEETVQAAIAATLVTEYVAVAADGGCCPVVVKRTDGVPAPKKVKKRRGCFKELSYIKLMFASVFLHLAWSRIAKEE
ncbi:hypothetical protein BJ741DRAFT_622839 [Chytriomyces cf. hyalinus JEL632]|nr:hypothetical protein BJ741DRAFT_622839 [Chytriomyces cf. hyalinus JEL632]